MKSGFGSSETSLLIFSSDTGGGHKSAAQALQDSFSTIYGTNKIIVINTLEEAHFITRFFSFLYNYILRHHQNHMHLYFSFIEKFSLSNSSLIFSLCKKFGKKIILERKPSAIISVHPMFQFYLVLILKELNLFDKIPIFTVLTDPCEGFWKSWACKEISQYFVPTESAKSQLLKFGVDESMIQIVGMPVHSRFFSLESEFKKKQLKESLNLKPNLFTVLVTAGWVGGGNIPKIIKALIQEKIDNLQIIFVSGQNTKLKKEIEILSKKSKYFVHFVGFTQKMETYMQASDIIITKLGGLTTFEALSCELPIFADCLTPPMPQEKGMTQLIESKGIGKLIYSAQQAVEEIKFLLNNPAYFQKLKSATRQFSSIGASDKIIKEILAYIYQTPLDINEVATSSC